MQRKRIIVLFTALIASLLIGCGAADQPAAKPVGPVEAAQTDITEAPTTPTETASVETPSEPQAPPNATPQTASEPVPEKIYAARCTISISCATILDSMDLCAEEKRGLVPSDGWILSPTEVCFEDGDSVFDVLLRVCREGKIHMEYSNTPIYDSAYIEGIGNLYEFDAGELSGWMYSVGGIFPNYGCSSYTLSDGDVIAWQYTCDLGNDIGGGYWAGG